MAGHHPQGERIGVALLIGVAGRLADLGAHFIAGRPGGATEVVFEVVVAVVAGAVAAEGEPALAALDLEKCSPSAIDDRGPRWRHRPRHGSRGDPQLQPRRLRCPLPRYAGGRPPTFTLPQRREIKKIELSIPTDLGRPFATWSLAKLADHLVAEGVVTDISHEGLPALLREEGVSFQAVRTWKRSNDPNFEPKKNRILELYEAADAGQARVICLDEFGPLNLQPQPGEAWAPLKKPRRIPRHLHPPPRRRHMLGAYDVGRDRLYGHVKKRKTRAEFLSGEGCLKPGSGPPRDHFSPLDVAEM